MKAISDFVKAWDSLPVGNHSPQAIQEWLNSPEMIKAVKELKRLNETGAEKKESYLDIREKYVKSFRSLVDEAAFGKEWAGGHFESEIIAQVVRLRQDREEQQQKLQQKIENGDNINRAIFILEDAGDYLATLYRKYNIPVTEQGLDPVKLREAARNLEDS